MKVFVAHSARDHQTAEALAKVLRDDGHNVFVPGDVVAGGDVLAAISAAIRSANVFVAVVSAGNPNVFYELGLAAGAGVPILITATGGELLPADLVSVPYVQLTGDSVRDAQAIARRARSLWGPSPTRRSKFESAEDTLRAASREPAVLESFTSTDFERLITELFEERGFSVSTTPSAIDAGGDFAITSKSGNRVVLVEVKKLSRQSRVSVETVRRLVSAVSASKASLGLLVSTSGYTAAASALAAETPIVLHTLREILAAKSEGELLGGPSPSVG